MSKPMTDAIKKRAMGLDPFSNQKVRKGGYGPEVWHTLSGANRWGIPLAGRSTGPAPGREVRRAKGIPSEAAGKNIRPFTVEDRPKRSRV